ncbi:MAG: GNAT family N-acetyltransferase [Candidatus Izemoplasmataceae bacterium]
MQIERLNEKDYASIPMRIEGESVYRLIKPGPLTFSLKKETTEEFGYDVNDEEPGAWKKFISMRNFRMVGIRYDDQVVAAMSLVHDNTTVRMLEGRKDVLLIWDLRVHPDHKRKGYGKALIEYARKEAKSLGVNHLRLETQNTNPNAIEFYLAVGFELAHIREHAYSKDSVQDAGIENEVMLVFNEVIVD